MPIRRSSVKGVLALFLLAGLTIIHLASPSFAREPIRTVTGTVTKVSDGDTIHVTTPEQPKLKVRLYGIDTPETPKPKSEGGRAEYLASPMGSLLSHHPLSTLHLSHYY